MSANSGPSGVTPRARRPRVANKKGSGALLGGALGAAIGATLGKTTDDLLTKAALGAVGGAIAGDVLSTQRTPLSLERSLRLYLEKNGAEFVSLQRFGKLRVSLLCNIEDNFWVLDARANGAVDWNATDLDDWLYGEVVLKFNKEVGRAQ